jgi:hypothetical protein
VHLTYLIPLIFRDVYLIAVVPNNTSVSQHTYQIAQDDTIVRGASFLHAPSELCRNGRRVLSKQCHRFRMRTEQCIDSLHILQTVSVTISLVQ